MSYAVVDNVKTILQIDEKAEFWDDEIESNLTSAESLVDAYVKKAGLPTVSNPPAQMVVDACAFYAASLFRKPRDEVSAKLFFEKAEELMAKYVGSLNLGYLR